MLYEFKLYQSHMFSLIYPEVPFVLLILLHLVCSHKLR